MHCVTCSKTLHQMCQIAVTALPICLSLMQIKYNVPITSEIKRFLLAQLDTQ